MISQVRVAKTDLSERQTRARRYRFGPFELNVRSGELHKYGVRLRLREQLFQILLLLLEKPGEVVLREEIRLRLWTNNTVVDFEPSINAAVKGLRQVLGETAAEPHYIETVGRAGYRFLAAVATAEEVSVASIPISAANGNTGPHADVQGPRNDPVEASLAASTSNRRISMATWGFISGSAAVALALTTAALSFFFSARTHTLSSADTIVVPAFANSTGESVFDDTLGQALLTELQQSPFINILPDRRVGSILKMMGHSADERLNTNTALEVCERSGSKVVLAGSIAKLGNEYVIGLNAIGCQTGGSLAREEVQAAAKERVRDALHKSARNMRRKPGESLNTLQKFDTQLEAATTPSLEALQSYSRGRQVFWKNDPGSAVPLLKRAIQLDPNFAMAYLTLGLSYNNLAEDGFEDNVRTAYHLREHVSEWERFAIESRYDHSVTGNLLKARQTTQLWAQSYPRDSLPVGLLADIDVELGHFDNVIAGYREAIRLDGWSGIYYRNLVDAYRVLNRLEEGRSAALEAQQKSLDSSGLHLNLYQIAFVSGDAAAMAEQVHWFAVTPGMQGGLLYWQAATAAYFGQLKRARELSRQLLALAEGAKDLPTAADCEAAAALREALFGNRAEARRRAASALRFSTKKDVEYPVALALAFTGDVVWARWIAADLAKSFPEDTIVKYHYLPAIRGRLSADPDDAIEILSTASPYELSDKPIHTLYPIYVRGSAYLAERRADQAVAEFEKIVKHRAIMVNEPLGPLAQLSLARAYVLQGDAARARAAYQGFLTLWREADSDIPILKQAKLEYEKLR